MIHTVYLDDIEEIFVDLLEWKTKAIKTETDYQEALKRLENIFEAKTGSAQGDELEILGFLVDQYEREHFPIDMPV